MRLRKPAALAAVLTAALAACHSAPPVPAPSSVPTPSPAPTAEAAPSAAPGPLEALRQKAAEGGSLCAVVYVGYSDTGTAEAVRSAAGGMAEVYPFLADIPDGRVVLMEGGQDVYCVLPADSGGSLSVAALDYDESGLETVGGVVYQGGGEPILLWCNVSDIMPNSLVTVAVGDAQAAFSPYISLKDGSTATTAPEGTVYLPGP